MKRALAVLAASAALGAAAADDANWYVQVDNDVFYGTDRWYTSGVRLARVAPQADHDTEWGLLQEIYTPEAKRHNPIDRPNAARLLGTFARHDRSATDWRTLEIDLGVTGPAALGRQAQDFVHRFVPAPAEDWSHQRSNRLDGELAWVRTAGAFDGMPKNVAVRTHTGVVLGNQIAFAHAGLELRFGNGAATALSTPAIRFAATPPLATAPDGSWSTFLGASVRAVAWNHLLDFGPGLDDPALDRRRIVQRFMGGVTWAGRIATATFTLVHETREFSGQRLDHGFGSVTLHVPF